MSPGAAAPPLLTSLTDWIASREVPLWGFMHQQVLLVTLRSVDKVAIFFPKSAVFALVWGISVRGWGIFALAIVFLGCASGAAF